MEDAYLWYLGKEGTKRFGELKSLIPGITESEKAHGFNRGMNRFFSCCCSVIH